MTASASMRLASFITWLYLTMVYSWPVNEAYKFWKVFQIALHRSQICFCCRNEIISIWNIGCRGHNAPPDFVETFRKLCMHKLYNVWFITVSVISSWIGAEHIFKGNVKEIRLVLASCNIQINVHVCVYRPHTHTHTHHSLIHSYLGAV